MCLTTDRLVVRSVHERDAWRLADYYAGNRHFLKPWEPIHDKSHCYPPGWQARLSVVSEFRKQDTACYFALLDPDEREIIGVANFSNVVRGSFHACYLGYSIAQRWQGQGLIYEVLTSAIRYMQRMQHIRHIMADCMPHNKRSGDLLARLGFEKRGYAKNYLLINGQWRNHVLMTLTTSEWTPGCQISDAAMINGEDDEIRVDRHRSASDWLFIRKTSGHTGTVLTFR